MKSLLILLFFCCITTSTACLSHASRHDQFLPLNNTFAQTNQPALNPSGYAILPLSHGAYMVTDGIYQSLVLISTAGVVVVDAPPTLGHNLQHAISNLTSLPVKWFIYSHSHADHAGGAYLFSSSSASPHANANAKNPVIIAHENTAEQLASANDSHRRPLPNITFRKMYHLQAGNQTLELFFPGVGHDLGNIIIYAPAQKVLMMVDQVYPGWVPFSGLAASVYVPGWMAAHDAILKYDFDVYLGGHMGGLGTRKDVQIQREYVWDVWRNCKRILEESGDPTNEVVGLPGIQKDVLGMNEGNYWALFAVYLDTVAERCYNVTNERWLGRLAAQDVFGYSHAWRMTESLRLDYDVLGPTGVQE